MLTVLTQNPGLHFGFEPTQPRTPWLFEGSISNERAPPPFLRLIEETAIPADI
jgi:hypothetical protein